MNHLKLNTSGIDCGIKDMQQTLYPSLETKWTDLDMYGRVYRNRKGGNTIPEIFDTKTQRYKDSFLDSKKRAAVFFIDGVRHTESDEGLMSADLKIVFLLNLQALFGDGYLDDRAQLEAFQSVQDDVHANFEIDGLEKTLPTVFSGFDTSKMEGDDMNPYHVFAITGRLYYELSNKC